MKLLAVSLSSLLVTANAFSPIAIGLTKRICHPIIYSSTILKSGADSYLDSLSDSSSRWASTTSTTGTTAFTTATTTTTTTTIRKLNLEIADALANGVIATATRNNFSPIVVTILDKQANTLVQKRMDGDICHVAFPEFSYAKAYTCVTMNTSSREFRDKYTGDGDPAKIAQLNSMMAITGRMAAFPGGVPLRCSETGEVIGAIGVSGAAGDEDEYAALRSVWDSGLGLTTQPREHSCTTSLD